MCAAALLIAACQQQPATPVEQTVSPIPAVSRPPSTVEAGAAPRAVTDTAGVPGQTLHSTASGLTGQVSDLQGLIQALKGSVAGDRILVELPADTLFAFDKAEVLPAAEANLGQLAQLISKTTGNVQLVGHTDNKGNDAYNADLSLRRAEAVSRWLQSRDVPSARLQIEGAGASQPIAPNTHPDGSDDASGRQRNRRVEAIIPLPQA